LPSGDRSNERLHVELDAVGTGADRGLEDLRLSLALASESASDLLAGDAKVQGEVEGSNGRGRGHEQKKSNSTHIMLLLSGENFCSKMRVIVAKSGIFRFGEHLSESCLLHPLNQVSCFPHTL
jgi:hypothetical protein